MEETKISGVDKLSFAHPLYLHPSNTQGISIISHTLTGTENYTIWSKAMRIALLGKHKLGFVDGTCQKESQEPGLQDQWERCNAVVLSWILGSISKELATRVIFFQNAHQVWNDLKQRFDKRTGTRIFSLHRELHSLRQGSNSVTHYFSKIKELWEEQANLNPLPSCSCATSKAYAETIHQQRLLEFLMGLNDSFGAARNQILLMNPLPTVNEAYAMVVEDEAHKTLGSSEPSPQLEGIAMVATGRGRGRGRGRGDPTLECTHCKKKGHTKEKCFQIIGYPANWRGPKAKQGKDSTQENIDAENTSPAHVNATTTVAPTFTKEQYDKILELLKRDNEPTVHALTGPSGWADSADW